MLECILRPVSIMRITLIAPAAVAMSAALASAEIDFNRDIRPIISDRCFKCHGAATSNQKSEFRLDSRENATADLGGYFGIVAGDLEESELHHRIWSTDSEEMMPPPKSKLTLSDPEKKLLDRWIKEGAKYDRHWAFKTLPAEIPIPNPGPEPFTWGRTPVDSFIWHELKKTELRPRPETSRERWLRRVTFDITGLPPTLPELDAFLSDKSKDAFEKVVARLLATEAYAERMTSE